MEWWNFSNTTFVIFFSICLLFILLVIALSITFAFSLKKDGDIAADIVRETNVVRVLIINPKENRVTYFDRINLKEKKAISLTKFFNNFHEQDVEKVKEWIYSMYIDHKQVDEYIEADIVANHGRNNYFSVLRLLKYDQDVGLIHVEGHVFRYISPNNFTLKKFKRPSNSYGLVEKNAFGSMINKRKSLKGFTYAIRFFYLKPQVTANAKIERFMAVSLKNAVYPFALDPHHCRQIIDDKDNELLLFDLNIDNKEQALHLAGSLEKHIRKNIVINGFQDSINFSLGIVENGQYFQDFDAIVESAQQACFYAQQNNQTVYLFQRSSAKPTVDLTKISKHVDYLLRPHSLRYLYRPIIDITAKDVLGYFEYVKAYESPLSGFDEMAAFAAKVDKNKELFSVISRQVVTEFAASVRGKKYKLFLSVSLLDIKYLRELLAQIVRIKECDLVLVFDEQEINDNVDGYDVLNAQYALLREDGYALALSLKNRDLLLDSSFYLNFDFFVVGSSMVGEIKQSGRTRLSLHVLIEQLLKYKKPIIATDLDGWQAIELLVQSGITVISSENITASNDMILPVDRKKMDRLTALADKYS